MIVVAGALVLGACLASSSPAPPDRAAAPLAPVTTLPTTAASGGDPTSTAPGATEVPVTETPTTAAPDTTVPVVKVPPQPQPPPGARRATTSPAPAAPDRPGLRPRRPSTASSARPPPMAVWAYQKLVMGLTGKAVTGKVTPDAVGHDRAAARRRPRARTPRPPTSRCTCRQQIAVLFQDGKPGSSPTSRPARGQEWCGETATAVAAPRSRPAACTSSTGARSDGWDDSVLGQLYNPVYFNYGVAVHGAYNVPTLPGVALAACASRCTSPSTSRRW